MPVWQLLLLLLGVGRQLLRGPTASRGRLHLGRCGGCQRLSSRLLRRVLLPVLGRRHLAITLWLACSNIACRHAVTPVHA